MQNSAARSHATLTPRWSLSIHAQLEKSRRRFFRPIAALLLAASMCGATHSQTVVAPTRADDAAVAADIDRFLSTYLRADEPGATVIVTRDGKPIFRKAYGIADMKTKAPLQPNMVMRIASMTKQFTAVAIMMLVEQGKLKLDDDFTLHVPDYPRPQQTVTVDQLLTHTSGIPGYTELPNFKRDAGKHMNVAQMLNRVKNLPLEFAPGSKMRYNNSAYYLLGAIIEQKSGMSYADFMAKNIFMPLGMNDTAYEGSERSARKRVAGYETKVVGNKSSMVPAFARDGTPPSAPENFSRRRVGPRCFRQSMCQPVTRTKWHVVGSLNRSRVV
jgi:D-alanyl-D-alanine carboxypeptidase